MMLRANISVISWWSVLLLEETGVSKENHRPAVPKLDIYASIHTCTHLIVKLQWHTDIMLFLENKLCLSVGI